MRNINAFLLVGIVSCSVAVSGCGSSGDSNSQKEPSTGIQNVTIGSLPSTSYNEGEPVTLTLPVQNPANLAMQYAWAVTHKGQNVPFTGQNTPSIQFNAPIVDDDSLVFATVELSLAGGRLIGDTTASTSLRIIDLNPNRLHQVSGAAFKNKGALVNSFDLSGVADEASWQFAFYFTDDVVLQGNPWVLHQTFSGVGHTKSNSEGEFLWLYCGDESSQYSLVNDALFPPYIITQCSLNEMTLKRYQDANNLFVEYYCEEDLVAGRAYQYIEEGIKSYGELSFSVGSLADAHSDSDACVDLTRSLFVDRNNQYFSLSGVQVYGESSGEAYDIDVALFGDNYGSDSYQFDDFFDEGEINSFEMNWGPLGAYSGVEEDGGQLFVREASKAGDFDAEFDMDFIDGEGNRETVEGTITLEFP